MYYTRSNGMRVPATVVGFAPDGLLHLEYFQDAVKVVNRQCKVESISLLKMKMLRVVLTQLVLLCPQCHTAKQNSLKLESTLAMYHSERLLHKSMHFAAKQRRPHQLTLKTKRQMHSMVHDAKIRTNEATDQTNSQRNKR